MSETEEKAFYRLRLPEGCNLKRKETYEYTTPDYTYDVDLYENTDGTFYSIGVPRDSERLVVYGSNMMPSAERALQILVDKIKREGMDTLFSSPADAPTGDEPEQD